MNILLTNFCNRSCPYCFAKGKLIFEKPLSRDYIKLKDLKIIVDFLKKSKQNSVGLLGGEPTLHPEFKKIVTTLIKAGFYLRIFTNGLINRDTVLFLKGFGAKKYKILLNINSPESYSGREWSILNRTMKLFANERLKLCFTIYKLDFHIDFIVGLIQKYHLNKKIRLGIAVPIFGCDNKYVKIADYPKVANRILDLVKENRSAGISFNFDCGFTLCSFTNEQLGKLFRLGSVPFSHCKEIVDVDPNLNVWRCFATSKIWNKKLIDFKDLNAVVNFYKKKFSKFRMVGSTSSCFRCEHLKFGNCSGGCLGYTLREFKLENRLEKLA